MTGSTVRAEEHGTGRVGAGKVGSRFLADGIHAVALGGAVLASWYLVVGWKGHLTFLSRSTWQLAGMWTVVATIFVYREKFSDSRTSAASRMSSTLVSFVLTLAYLSLFPFTAWGLAIVVGLGALIVDVAGRPQDSVTTGITTAVVMVVAALGPASEAWTQPIVRLGATAIGAVIGLGAAEVTRRCLAALAS